MTKRLQPVDRAPLTDLRVTTFPFPLSLCQTFATHKSRDKYVDKYHSTSHKELVLIKPTSPSVSLLDYSIHYSLCLVAARSRDAQLRSARRSVIAIEAIARSRINLILLHPLPILYVNLGPLGAKFGTAIAGLDVAFLSRGCLGI